MGVPGPLASRSTLALVGMATLGMATLALATVLPACSNQSTGLHVTVHRGAQAYDELRFGIVAAGVDGGDAVTLVDPETLGRRAGPFPSGDPDIVILLRDDIDGRVILCDVTILHAGLVVGTGHNAMQGQAHHIRDMDVFIDGTGTDDGGVPGDDAAADADSDGGGGGDTGGAGDGGRADARDAAGDSAADSGTERAASDSGAGGRDGATATDTGGADSRGADGGSAGTGANGVRCTGASTCASLHCVDGVCCESACGTACSSCAIAGQEGRCRAVAARAPDPHGLCVDSGAASCGTNGLCDGAGACARYPFGTICAPAVCADALDRFSTGICSGVGACTGIGRVACPAPARSCVAGSCL
jgi:hypothetical protein